MTSAEEHAIQRVRLVTRMVSVITLKRAPFNPRDTMNTGAGPHLAG